MAYIKPKMNVFFANSGKAITAVIDKIAFRKYMTKPYKDPRQVKTAQTKVHAVWCVCDSLA